MLITDTSALQPFYACNRIWQGIPGIERTKKGRIFSVFYSGNVTEAMGNYCVVLKSDDGGKTFSEPIAAAYMGEDARAYDSTLWIDPLGRLWFIWSVIPDSRVEFAICNAPDADVLSWGPVRLLGHDIMLNKPIVTKQGEWMFPVAVWGKGIIAGLGGGSDGKHDTGAHVYVSRDQGETFEKRGCAVADKRCFDEHMFLEKQNGDLEVYIRTFYGIAKAVSRDGGHTFSEPVDSGLGGPNSRFHITRLRSGRVLLVNHDNFTGRNNLTAMLSEDDGVTYPYKLLLDGRDQVSYPDVKEGEDGYIYITYDRERGAHYDPKVDYSTYAKEILMAKITEQDILCGRVQSQEGALRMIISKLK